VSLLEMRAVSKAFFGVPVLCAVDLSLERGQALGLIGENGAGKSTLMNILGGTLPPDAGAMTLDGQIYAPRHARDARARGVGFIHQELNLFVNLSIAENLFMGRFPRGPLGLIRQREMMRGAAKLLEAVELELPPTLTVERLSPGERQLVEIAGALGMGAQVLIFDEPTTSLTHRETERLFALLERLKLEGRSLIYISHILSDVARLCEAVCVLRDGQNVGAGRTPDFPVPRMISLMVGRSLEQLYPPKTATPSEEALLEVSGVSQSGVVENVSLAVHAGEVLGLYGLMGSGRSELARILFGLDPFERGEIRLKGALQSRHSPRARVARGMAFVTENRREEGLMMDASILDNLALVSLPRFAPAGIVGQGKLRRSAVQTGASLQLKSASLETQAVRNLSGGNQQKVVLGKWLMNAPRVFVLDEPTRGVDVGAKYEIYSIVAELARQGAGLLVISSELEELMGICDRILVMAGGELRAEFRASSGPGPNPETGPSEPSAPPQPRTRFERERILAAAFRQDSALVEQVEQAEQVEQVDA